MKIIIANWKMYLSSQATVALAKGLALRAREFRAEVILCPNFTAIGEAGKLIKKTKIKLGAQDVFWQTRGAYTGEVSPSDLKDLGCKYVIVGHSERRRYLNENDEMLRKKVAVALGAGLVPIFCVGENQRERRSGAHRRAVRRQLKTVLRGLTLLQNRNFVIAYEPVWAIGTGEPERPEDAVEMHKVIRGAIKDILPASRHSRYLRGTESGRSAPKSRIKIIYGGSVDSKNIGSFLEKPEIDGALVGGASTRLNEFIKIIKSANNL